MISFLVKNNAFFFEYINTIFEIFCLFYMLTESLKTDLRPTISGHHPKCTLTISALVLGSACRYLLNRIDFPFPGLIGFYMILGILFSLVMFRRNFFTYTLLIMIYSTLVMLSRHIVGTFFNLYLSPLLEIHQGLIMLLFMLFVIFAISKLLIAAYKNVPNAISFSNWFFFMLLFLCIYYAFDQIETRLSEDPLLLFILIVIAVLVCEIFFQLLHIAADYEKKLKDQLLIKELTMNQTHINEVNNLYENFRSMRHEMKNNIFYMQSLLDDREYEKLDQYFSEFHEKFENLDFFVDTGNQTLNAILNAKLAEARRKQIPVEMKAAAPDTLPIHPSELFSLMSNMLDNAMEGMSREHPGLSVNISPQKGYLVIEVKNRVDTDILKENPALETTKPDAKFHGYGTKVMKKIAEDYEGWVDFSVEDGWFSVRAYILLPGV